MTNFTNENLLESVRNTVKLSSYNNYKNRLETLVKICDGKDLTYVLLNPINVYSKMKKSEKIKTISSMGNYITPVCKVFTSNKEFLEANKKHYDKWRKYLQENREDERDVYKQSKPSEKQLENMVPFKDIKAKLYELSEKEPYKDFDTHMQYLLLAFMVYTVPKRSDYGNLEILKQFPRKMGDRNLLVLSSKKPKLILNKYKTANYFGSLEEDIPTELQEIMKLSLEALPRKYVFGFYHKGEFTPYVENNSYSKFFMNTCKKLFGKPMGPSLFRHIYISDNLDPSKIAFEDHEKIAKLMGHSMGMQRLVYHWVKSNDKQEPNLSNSSSQKRQ